VTTFLTDLFQSPGDTRVARADTISARTLLARGTERVRTELADQPAVLAPLLGAIGTASQRLGIPGFPSLFAQERDALERAFGADDARVTDALRRQGSAFMRERGFPDAVARYAEVAARHARLGAPDSARLAVLLDLANALVFSEQADSAAAVLHATERLRARVPTAASIDAIADAQVRLAAVRRRQGQLDAADSLLRGALALGPGDEIRAQLLNNLGSLLQARGRPEDAEPVYRDAAALARRLYPPVERDRNVVANNWAGVLARLQRHEEALAVLRDELATHRAHFPADSWRLGTAEGAMAIQLHTMQRLPDALAHRRTQVAIFTQGLGPAHAWTLGARLDLAELLDATGEAAEARSERDAVEAAAPEIGNEAERTRLLERIRQARGTAGPTVGRADSTRHRLVAAVLS
jgi:serine/threonine-protein kinase